MSIQNDFIQKEPVESGMSDTAEVTELYGVEPGGIFDFIGRDLKEHTIKTCWGDLMVMCNALEDYANVLDRAVEEWELQEYQKAIYQIHAARCRKIAGKYAAAIGYDREAALKKCRKRREKSLNDVGEDALALLANRRGRNQNSTAAQKDLDQMAQKKSLSSHSHPKEYL
ncbi:MAG: hypothetical protein K2O18_05185 [Oscillospiraceae bacterium]|nr:hypothetical protein [Oscillospiraceae bacterium]